MEKVLFELKDVKYCYPGEIKALDGINLSILRSSCIVLMGANGSGKSTLLMMLNGLLFPSSGKIFAFDRELTENVLNEKEFLKFFRQKIGFVFQNPDIQLFCPTVKEDIAFGPLNLGIREKEVEYLVEKIADNLGITKLLSRPPYRLSIGEKKKVAIATALVIDPDIIIMDEPTAGLDPLTTKQILDILIKKKEEDKTLILATHDVYMFEEIADVIHIIGKNKKIVASGPSREILKDKNLLLKNNLLPIHPYKTEDIFIKL